MPGHALPLETFVSTSEQAEAIIDSFNRELFGGQLRIQIDVLPPEEGSFLTRLRIVMLGGFGLVWLFSESDIGKAFIRGLTDHEPAYWAEIVGRTAKANLDDALLPEAQGHSLETECESLILGTMTRSFLEKDAQALERVGVSIPRFREAYEARNSFYEACQATEGLRAIGFREEPLFPIDRAAFSRLQVVLPPPTEEPEPPWQVDTFVFRVTSPNWDREDRSRQWKARDGQRRERYFRIEDEEFWERVRNGTIETHILDQMKVQMAFQGAADQPRNCRVLRVLEFNGTELAAPLDDNSLVAQLGRLERVSSEQGSLFE